MLRRVNRSRAVVLRVALLAWGAGAFVYATHLYLYHALQEEPSSFPFELAEASVHFGVWALLTPLVLRLAAVADLFDRRWARRLFLVHLPAALLVALAQLALHTVLDLALVHGGWHSTTQLADRFRSFFVRTYYANVVVYLALALGANAFAYVQRRRTREAELERHLAQAQLDALRLQLQPHFLFNALNAVAALVVEDPAAAQRMLARLADLLRLVLDARNAGTVTLARELELAAAYLAIEQVRFADRLTVSIDAAPEALDALVPGMLLQPLLENAVRHGIARKPGPGRIELHAAPAGDRLRLRVVDDGVGLDVPPAARGGEGDGIGLANVRARLERIYGADHELLLRRARGGGTEAFVELPLRRKGTDGP
jgi:hypothetical protein